MHWSYSIILNRAIDNFGLRTSGKPVFWFLRIFFVIRFTIDTCIKFKLSWKRDLLHIGATCG